MIDELKNVQFIKKYFFLFTAITSLVCCKENVIDLSGNLQQLNNAGPSTNTNNLVDESKKIENNISFDPPSGSYNTPITVKLTTQKTDAKIYYTTD